MKKFLNGIALLLCVMSFYVITGCSYANNSPAPAPDPIPGQAAAPVLNPESGAVDYGDTVEITCATEGASIHYTTDGTAPTAESFIYTSPIAITSDTTIKAIVIKTGITSSEPASSTYTVKSYTVTFDANGHGTAPEPVTGKHKGETITLPAALTETGFTFDQWTDGQADYDAGAEYTISGNATLKAKWTEWGKAAIPTFSIAAGEVDKGTKVSVTSTTEGAVIYYTTDGSEPTAASTKYESEIEITTVVTIKAIVVKSGLKDSDVVSASYTVDVTPPANVTDLTAKCTASQTVKLTWTNPADADFAKVVITYGTDGKIEVLKTATPNNEATITSLTNGTEYTFTVKAYDEGGNASSGVSVNCTPGLLGGLFGTPTGGQTQGAVLKDTLKETWMAANGNLKVGGTEIAKTSEVVVVPTGTVATVTMPDDSSWSTYYSDSDSLYNGVFLKDRKVKLDPFIMSQYEVTQKLYNEVMGENPSGHSNNPAPGETQENRPVENVDWYKACAFCNELTKKTMAEADCVYYSDEQCATPYTISNANSKDAVYASYDTSIQKWTKKGYRLPTEAEWEFAARGGDPNALDSKNNPIWSYAYAGVQTEKNPSNFISSSKDAKLDAYGWYVGNSNEETHEVGLKEKNKLNLYDMSGNVWEWCYDWFNYTAGSNDSAYTVDGYVQNPVGALASGSDSRCGGGGGSYGTDAFYCTVSFRYYNYPDFYYFNLGFRVCRSTN